MSERRGLEALAEPATLGEVLAHGTDPEDRRRVLAVDVERASHALAPALLVKRRNGEPNRAPERPRRTVKR